MSEHERRLHEAIQAEAEHLVERDPENEHLPETAVLVNWILVSEWAGSDGGVWMTELHSESLAYWQSIGLLEATKQSVLARRTVD